MRSSPLCSVANWAVLILRMHQSPLKRMMDSGSQPLGWDPCRPALEFSSRKRGGKIELRQPPPSTPARLIHVDVVEEGLFRRGEGDPISIFEAPEKLGRQSMNHEGRLVRLHALGSACRGQGDRLRNLIDRAMRGQ